MFCNDKLGGVVELAIVSIDKNLKIERKKYVFKPRTSIELAATKVHGLSNKFFEDNNKLYQYFGRKDASDINLRLKDMKYVYAHNQIFDYLHI